MINIYIGDIISDDMKSEKNLKDKTNRAVRVANKISTKLSERPHGKHFF